MITTVINGDPGVHGNFLEYIVNRYIFKVSFNGPVFFSSGAAHAKNNDSEYKENRSAVLKHVSYLNDPIPAETKNIIHIVCDYKFNIVLLTNIFHRCMPENVNKSVSAKDIEAFQLERIYKNHNSNARHVVRNDLYTKLIEGHYGQKEKLNFDGYKNFHFSYNSFFSLLDFIKELKEIAKFLGMGSLTVDNNLINDWHDFIAKNQGMSIYQQGQKLLNDILLGNDVEIEENIYIESYINYLLTEILNLFEGPMFSDDVYPKSTKVIHDFIKSNC